ncbi:MAG: outer membrane lipoprotein-sorting protein [Bacteroidales bacterium]|nr:outer membrane lipoprotein-sorting protein [Bacteroidales bacterium]
MKKLITFFVWISIAFATISAQNIDEIILKYHESMGGLEKLKALNSLKLTGKMPTPMGELLMVIYKKSPDMTRTEVDFQGQKMVQAYDGETAWMINPMMGSIEPQKLEGEMARSIIDQAVFEDPFINYEGKGHEVTLDGEENLDGIECYKVRLVMNKNNEDDDLTQVYYLDKEYFLPVMVRSWANNTEIETYMSDYQEVGNGLTMAFNMEIKAAGQPGQIVLIDSVEVNVEMDDELFSFPVADQ